MERIVLGTNGDRIKLSLGFVIHIATTIIAITLAYASLRSDLNIALKEAQQGAIVLEQQRELINTIKFQQGVTQQMLNDFRIMYERDMSRYIRETPSK